MQSLQISFNKNLYPNDAQAKDLIKKAGHFLNELANCAKPNRARDFAEKLADIDSPQLMKQQVGIYIGLGKLKAKRSYSSIWKSYKESNKDKKLSTDWTIQNANDPCLNALKNLERTLDLLIKYTNNSEHEQSLSLNNDNLKKQEKYYQQQPTIYTEIEAILGKDILEKVQYNDTIITQLLLKKYNQYPDNSKMQYVFAIWCQTNGYSVYNEFFSSLTKSNHNYSDRVIVDIINTLNFFGIYTNLIIDELLRQSKQSLFSNAFSALMNLAKSNDTVRAFVVEVLLSVLKTGNSDTKQKAAETLGQLGVTTNSVVDGLILALGDKEFLVSYKAQNTLITLANKSDKVKSYLVEGLLNTLKTGNYEAKKAAMGVLGKLGVTTDPVLEDLVQALGDKEILVGSKSVDALTALVSKDDKATLHLIPLLLNTLRKGNNQAQLYVIDLLGKLGVTTDSVLEGLVQSLKYYLISSTSADALVELVSKDEKVKARVVKLLINFLKTSKNYSERKEAVIVLRKLAVMNDQVVEGLVQALRNGNYNLDDYRVLETTDNLYKYHNSLLRLMDNHDKAKGYLAELLLDEIKTISYSSNKISIFEVVGKLGVATDKVFQGLVEILDDKKYSSSTLEELEVIERILLNLTKSDEQAKERLIKLLLNILQTDKELAQIMAAEMLLSLNVVPEPVLEGLNKALVTTSSHYVQSKVSETLYKLAVKNDHKTKTRVVELFLNVLKTDNNKAKKNAIEKIELLAMTTDPVLEGLVQGLEDKNFSVSSKSVDALVALASKNDKATLRLIPLLLNTLKTGNEKAKLHTLDLLGKLGVTTDPVLEVLVQLLSDKEHLVSSKSVDTLTALISKDDKATLRLIPLLLNTLKTGNEKAKLHTLDLLGKLGVTTDPVLEGLVQALEMFSVGSESSDVLAALASKDDKIKARVVKLLISNLKTAKYNHERKYAVKTLSKLAVMNNQVVEGLVQALRYGNYDLDHYRVLEITDNLYKYHNSLLRLMKNQHQAKAYLAELLLDKIKTTSYSSNKIRIIELIGKLGVATNKVFQGLVEILDDKKYSSSTLDELVVIERVLFNLTKNDEQARERLIKLLLNILQTDKELAQIMAAQMLLSLNIVTEPVLEGLTKALAKTDSSYVRIKVGETLTKLAVKNDDKIQNRVVECLLEALKKGNSWAKEIAIREIQLLGIVTDPVLEVLVQSLSDRDHRVIDSAGDSLIALAEKDSETKQKIVLRLLPLLQQKNENNTTRTAKKILTELEINIDQALKHMSNNDKKVDMLDNISANDDVPINSFSSINQSLTKSENKTIIHSENNKPLMNNPILTFSTQQTHEDDNESHTYQNQPSQVNYIE